MTRLNENLTPAEDAERAELTRAYAEVAASAAGKRVLFDILEFASVYSSAFSGQDHATDYSLGRQSSGLYVIDKLNELDPRMYPKLLLEIADMKAVALAAKKLKQEREDDDIEA